MPFAKAQSNIKNNQSTVSSAKRLASFFGYLIPSTIDTLHNTINGYEIACTMYMTVCIIQTNADSLFQKTYCFYFLLTLNCKNRKQLLPLAMF